MGWKHLSFNHGIVRGISAVQCNRDQDQRQRDEGRGGLADQRVDWHSGQRDPCASDEQQRFSPKAVGEYPGNGLQTEGPNQYASDNQRRSLLFETCGVDQIFQHIGGESIRGEAAATRHHRNQYAGAFVITPKQFQR